MKKKAVIAVSGVIVVLTIALNVLFLYSIGAFENKSLSFSEDIGITLSTVINRADLENENYAYSLTIPDDYEETSGYNVYNYYLKIQNNSKYDVYNVRIPQEFKSEDFILNQDTMNDFDPFYIKSEESGFISLVICIKNDLTEAEINEIMHKLPKLVVVNLVTLDEEYHVNYSKTAIVHYDITDEDYSKEDVQYQDVL